MKTFFDNLDRIMRVFLAIVITLGFFAVLGGLFYLAVTPNTSLETGIKEILLVMLGALLSSWKEVTGWSFGSSSGSDRKTDQNAALTAQLAAQPNVAALPTVGPTEPNEAVKVKIDDSTPVHVTTDDEMQQPEGNPRP